MHAFTRKTGKMIILLLAAAAVLFAVAACNRGGGDSGETIPGVDHSQPPRLIRLASWHDYGPGLGIRAERPDPNEEDDYEVAMMQWNNANAVAERFNVRFESFTVGEYHEFHEAFLAHQLANDPIGELIVISGSYMQAALAGNHIIDIATLQYPGSNLFGSQTVVRPGLQMGGSIYSLDTGAPSRQHFWLGVNWDMVQRLGLQDPVALFDAGNWTWDAFLSMTRAAGAAGYWGVAGWVRDFAQGIIAMNDGQIATDNFMYALDSPNTLAAIELLETLWNEELYWHEPGNVDSIWDWWGLSTAFHGNDVLFWAAEFWHAGMVGYDWSDPPYEFRVVPFPRGPQGSGRYHGLRGFQGGWAIPTGVQDPELVFRVFEALNEWPGDDLWILTDADDSDTRQMVWTEKCVEINNLVARNTRFDAGSAAGIGDIPGNVADWVFQGVRTAAEAAEYLRGESQETLDNAARVMGIR
ncbi:MAG: hypothetical protein FWD90_11655 [Defluviitaleaceae bacterium]|nr:hypothetical protein [Defluviitaleaceae bacterium]